MSFFRSFLRSPGQVGAVAPSSRFLCRKMVGGIVGSSKRHLRVLEVGAGTGVITKELAGLARAGTTFSVVDVVEIDRGFCKSLRQQFGDFNIHCQSILDWKPAYKYDYIVSSLPFNAFSESQVAEIIKHYGRLLESDGVLSYYEYVLVPQVARLFLQEKKRKKMESSIKARKHMLQPFDTNSNIVVANFPPAKICHVKMGVRPFVQ